LAEKPEPSSVNDSFTKVLQFYLCRNDLSGLGSIIISMKFFLSTLLFGVAIIAFGKGGGTNTIQYAVDTGNLDMVKSFLAINSALLTPKESAGLLTSAAVHGQTEMAAFLISKGADVNEKGFFGMPPLSSMASVFKSPNDIQFADIATLLIAHGAEVDPVDEYHKTPLLHAVEFQNYHLADVLLKNGASLAVTFTGTYARLTPLFYALRHSDQEMVAVIMKFKPPLETYDSEGDTPLLWAVKHKNLETARMLLEHGASVAPTYTFENSGMRPMEWNFSMVINHDVNNHGNTPLHWAIFSGDKDMVALLLKFKAPLDVKNAFGATPLELATVSENAEIARMVRQAAPATLQFAPGTDPATLPSLATMRDVAKRIADGDDAAFDELETNSLNLYRGINYKTDQWRVQLNFGRMHAAFEVLGQEAAKGNDKAFQALKKSLTVNCLKSFAPDELGVAAAAGNKKALDILFHYRQWGMLESEANQALEAPAAANLRPVVDYFAAILLDPANANRGLYGAATIALKSAAAKGNTNAQAALDKFNASQN
jgi:ankyrin repeat protein